jgi:hypothetical protein
MINTEGLHFMNDRNRFVFIHPDDSSKCIKVVNFNHKRRRDQIFGLPNIFRRSVKYTNDNVKDIYGYSYLLNKSVDIWKHIPRYYGTIDTDIGTGQVYEFIKNAYNINDFVDKYGWTKELEVGLSVFCGVALKYNIPIRDPHPGNFLVYKNTKGELVVVAIEFGVKLVFPIMQKIEYFNRKLTQRRLIRMINGLQQRFPEYKIVMDEFIQGHIINIKF